LITETPTTIALAGNPNAGKTTVFNALTGARQHVGNYPGVTVEKKEGTARYDGRQLHVVDLPGTYSLTAFSVEEVVARNYLIDEEPAVVVHVVDASNLERNLYLTVQLLELGVPLVVALNMSDLAADRGLEIDARRLSELLGVPVVPTVGHRGEGMNELLAEAVRLAGEGADLADRHHRIDYGTEIEPHVEAMTDRLRSQVGCERRPRWYALKLLEGDEQTHRRLGERSGEVVDELSAEADRFRRHIERITGDDIQVVLADRRYGFIAGACAETVRQVAPARWQRSELIDRFVLHPLVGLVVFGLMMYGMFQLTFTVAQPLVELLDAGFGALGSAVGSLWPAGSDSLLKSLLVDGIIGGVGGVLALLPNIMVLFLAIALLEDSGYMARAAFLMDQHMHRIGLHGKSFIPMLIGFGCSVPAIMATRTLETRRDRLVTMLVLPLMSCGARLSIYVMIIPAFFPDAWQAPVLWIVYLVGIALAVASAKLLRMTLLRGESVPFVMELPPYRLPTLRGLGIHTWERSWHYVKKAGTVILAISIVLWALSVWPGLSQSREAEFDAARAAVRQASELSESARAEKLAAIDARQGRAELEASAIGQAGKAVAPLLAPAGFDWKISTGLMGAFAAKEVFVAQMGIVYAVGDTEADPDTLREKMRSDYSPLQGFCVLLFTLITAPCIATIAITARESGAWRWAILQLVGLTVMAWVVTTGVYQTGRLLGLGTS
jgi:ferrous iron transport protein B